MFWLKKWRRNRLAMRRFPEEWLKIIERNVPFYNNLSSEDRTELQHHILIFIGEKRFEGCGGLEITDEIKVSIAAQACVLILHRKTDYYPGLFSVLVYPGAFISPQTEHLESGVDVELGQVLLGQSWHRGSIVLSWDNVKRGAAEINDGHNVVFHEFAHQIDSNSGRGDSTAVLKNSTSFIAWASVLQKDFEKLRREVSQNRPSLLDEYGATSPAEFFAVATEFFFEKPKELKEKHPELYNELKRFYQQDPAGYLLVYH